MSDRAYDAQATGANNGTSWADACETLDVALALAGEDGTVYASHTSAEVVGGISYAVNKQRIISVDASGGVFPPPAGTYLRGASLTNPSSDIGFSALGLYCYGMDFSVGNDFLPTAAELYFNDCTVTLTGVNDRFDMGLNAAPILRNFTLIFGDPTAAIEFSAGRTVKLLGGAISGSVNNLLTAFRTWGRMEFEGWDLSSAANLCQATGGSTQYPIAIFKGCPLKSGFTTHTGTLNRGTLIALYGSHSSNIPYFIQEVHSQGSLITETIIVKDDGSSDGITPISMKFVTGADAVETVSPLRMALPILFYTETTGVQTFDVEIVNDGNTLQNDEVWLEASVPGTTIKRDISNGLPTDIMTAPANLAASSVTWTTTGLSSPVKQKVSITVDVKQAGWVEFHICVAKPSITMYADVKILPESARQFLVGQAYINGEAAAGNGGGARSKRAEILGIKRAIK